jgi:hypothetical protein
MDLILIGWLDESRDALDIYHNDLPPDASPTKIISKILERFRYIASQSQSPACLMCDTCGQ